MMQIGLVHARILSISLFEYLNMNKKIFSYFTAFCMLFLLCSNFSHATHTLPNVVVSIPPLHALVAAVMENVGTPTLLLKPGTSPHNYSLKPSEVQLLYTADVIFWAGPNLESFLTKILDNTKNLKTSIRTIPLVEAPGLLLLPIRANAVFEPHTHCNHAHVHDHNQVDMHFWLDPMNAKILVNYISETLSTSDPIHKKKYQENAEKTKQSLDILDARIQNQLKALQKMPYIVFHDAYQYFEHRYGLNGVGAITINPEIPPSAKRLKTIQNIIKNTHATCVFSEPQFQSKIIKMITQGTNVNTGQLDPLGTKNKQGFNNYIFLLDNLSGAFNQCYAQGKP